MFPFCCSLHATQTPWLARLLSWSSSQHQGSATERWAWRGHRGLLRSAERCVRVREVLECRRDILRASTPVGWKRTHQASWLRAVSLRLGFRMRLEVKVRGLVPDEPCVIVANHMSYLDALAIGRVLPLSAVAKSEITGWPALGDAMEELGIVFVNRGCAMSGAVALRKSMRILRAGVPVLVFPEGTTTTGNDVLPFCRGAFGIARLMRVPVVPATLRYESREASWVGDASLVPHLVKLHRHNKVKAELTFGPRLEPTEFADSYALASATRVHIRNNLRR